MIARIAFGALLVVVSNRVGAQPAIAPDRAPELMQLQFNSRATQPPQGPMDGPRATALYKRFSQPAASGQAPGAPATPSGPNPQ
jgi:hypothetical protein